MSLLGILLLLQLPIIQTQLAHWATEKLSEELGFEISVKRLSIRWLDELRLIGLQVIDRQGEEMINADVLQADFSLFSLIRGSDIYIDQAVLADASVNLIQRDELNITELIDGINLLTTTEKDPADTAFREPNDIHIAHIILDNVNFKLDDPSAPKLEEGLFDYAHIHIKGLTGIADKFSVIQDTIALKVRNLKGKSADGLLQIHNLQTDFVYHRKELALLGLSAQVNQSHIRDTLRLQYESPEDFQDFNRLVRIKAHLDSSKISISDIRLFSPTLAGMNDRLLVSANIGGTVSNLLVRNLDASFGDSSRVYGKMHFIGLPDAENALVDFRFKPSQVLSRDLQKYLPPEGGDLLDKLGKMRFSGNFYGLFSDFKAEGKFKTAVGSFETDLRLLTTKEVYKGKIKTQKLNLGKLLGQQKYVQEIDMKGDVAGRGFALDRADLKINAKVSRLGVLNYDYDSLFLDAHIQRQKFKGVAKVIDPNLKVEVDGDINFADSTFNFTTFLDTLNLKPTNLSQEEGAIHLRLDADFKGLDPALVSGTVGLSNTSVHYGLNSLEFDSLIVDSKVNPLDSLRELAVHSNLFDLEAMGKFSYNQLIGDVGRFWQEIQLHFSSNDSLRKSYYLSEEYQEIRKLPPTWIDCQLNIHEDANTAFRLFDPYIYFEGTSSFSVMASTGENHTLSLKGYIPSVLYNNYQVWEDSFNISMQKPDSTSQFDIKANISSARQQFGKLETKNLRFSAASTQDSLLSIRQYIEHASSTDLVDLQGLLSFQQDSIWLDFSDTHFNFLEREWQSEGACEVAVRRDFSKLFFKEVRFQHLNQIVSINGNLGEDVDDVIRFIVKDLDLAFFSTYIGKDIQGRASITADLREALDSLKLESQAILSKISIDQYPIGTFQADSKWDSGKEQLDIDAFLSRTDPKRKKDFKVLKLNGYYKPQEPNVRKRLNLQAILDGLSLQVFQPFVEEHISNLGGTGIGLLSIKGSPGRPILKGDILIYEGKFKVNYLNTTYHFSDQIKIREDFIGMKELRLYDQNNHQAFINGGLYHTDFGNIIIDIAGRMDAFMALNTTATQSNDYYGTAVATGSFSVFGSPNDIDLLVNARTDKGTKIYIPLDGYASVEDADFIRFVDRDSTAIEDSLSLDVKKDAQVALNQDPSGFKMDFNVELTPDAYCEIIFDKKAGDIIRGSGQGKIKMEIDLLGDFSMIGDVEILQGAYNFTLLNVVNKQFGVQPNSFIRWSGDPYGAALDITATYTQKSSLLPVFGTNADSTLLNAPEMRRAYPVQVLLNLEGELLSPNITFGLDIKDYPNNVMVNGAPISLESYVAGFEQRLRNDEQELNKQVFSLIVLKRLSQENAFSGISQSAGSSVSELLTNQLSYWVSQVDENLEIDFDLNGLNAEALNAFQLSLSYTFLNGRLRVSREGGFTNLQNEADLTSVIGDWTLEYLLTPDGKLRLKMYRKQNMGTLSGTTLENNATNGVSILRSKSFESFGDLFKGKKKRRRDQSEKPANPNEQPAERSEEEEEEEGRE